MESNTSWLKAGVGTQLFLLLVFLYFGFVLGAFIPHLILGEGVFASSSNILLSRAIQTICFFLLPSLTYMIVFSESKTQLIKNTNVSLLVVILAIATMLSIQPFIETVNHYNDAFIRLPESMASLQEFFDESAKLNSETVKLLFADKTIVNLLFNLLVLSILPGILEEVFFRGILQNIFLRTKASKHLAVWLTAIIFSLLHFQLTGFFPRILLGALLGYSYLWTSNILVPIVMHIFHNGLVVIMRHFSLINESTTDHSINVYTAISIVSTAILLYVLYKRRKKSTEFPSC